MSESQSSSREAGAAQRVAVIAGGQPLAPVESDFDVALAVDLALCRALRDRTAGIRRCASAPFSSASVQRYIACAIALAEVEPQAVGRFVDAEHGDRRQDRAPGLALPSRAAPLRGRRRRRARRALSAARAASRRMRDAVLPQMSVYSRDDAVQRGTARRARMRCRRLAVSGIDADKRPRNRRAARRCANACAAAAGSQCSERRPAARAAACAASPDRLSLKLERAAVAELPRRKKRAVREHACSGRRVRACRRAAARCARAAARAAFGRARATPRARASRASASRACCARTYPDGSDRESASRSAANCAKRANSRRRPSVTAFASSGPKSQKKRNGVDAANSSPMKSIGGAGASSSAAVAALQRARVARAPRGARRARGCRSGRGSAGN